MRSRDWPFLELMTQVLGIQIEDYGTLVNQSREFIELSNTCAIFAESELVSLIAQGKRKKIWLVRLSFSG